MKRLLSLLLPLCLLQATGVWAEDAASLALQGATLQEQGKPLQAEQILRQCLELDPDNIFAMNRLGLSLLRQGRFEAARVWFSRAASRDAGDTFSRIWLGALDMQEQDEDAARTHFAEVLELAPDNADAHYFLGVLAAGSGQAGQAGQAVQHFKQAGRSGAADPALQCRLARAYMKLDMADAARNAYEQALAQAPQHGPALLGLGWLLYNQGQSTQAMEVWRQALRLPDAAGQARESLALAANKLALDACAGGDAPQARTLWQQALDVDPGNRAAQHYLKHFREKGAALGAACAEQGGLLQ